METAYLYVRVSTDEQKKKGNSLLEQENRLIKHCKLYNVIIKGIYREDYSAKNFNRPEWKKLIATIKKDRLDKVNNILIVKWDRFSRNAEYAYEMIGMLRRYNTTVTAIDQPVEFSVPESAVVLAFYLSIPEAENSRRALNTIRGIRMAKEMGRYPNKAPLGYMNVEGADGKKYIKPRQPYADILVWAFDQLEKNFYSVNEVCKMANAKGLKCSRSHFWKLVRNPVYCGFVRLTSDDGEQQLVRAIHEPIISEELFNEVQKVIGTKRRAINKVDELKSAFILKGYLYCPKCGHRLSASFSTGRSKKYAYYHCRPQCKQRLKAYLTNDSYNNQLQRFSLSKGAVDLFTRILREENTSEQRTKYLHQRKRVQHLIAEQETIITRARKLLVTGILKLDDFIEVKKEYIDVSGTLNKELDTVVEKLKSIENQFKLNKKSLTDIFTHFQQMDTPDKRQIINLMPPDNFDTETHCISLKPDRTISKILNIKNDAYQ